MKTTKNLIRILLFLFTFQVGVITCTPMDWMKQKYNLVAVPFVTLVTVTTSEMIKK